MFSRELSLPQDMLNNTEANLPLRQDTAGSSRDMNGLKS